MEQDFKNGHFVNYKAKDTVAEVVSINGNEVEIKYLAPKTEIVDINELEPTTRELHFGWD